MTLIEASDFTSGRLLDAGHLGTTLTQLVDTDPDLAELTLGEVLAMYAAQSDARRTRRLSTYHSPSDIELFELSANLSTRQMQVVRLLAEGLSNREIGLRLDLSDKTIKNHISHILRKLQLSARTQVAIMALRAGLA